MERLKHKKEDGMAFCKVKHQIQDKETGTLFSFYKHATFLAEAERA